MLTRILTLSLMLLLTHCGTSSSYSNNLGPVSAACTGKKAYESYQCSDGCNTCWCDPSGHEMGTLMMCTNPASAQ